MLASIGAVVQNIQLAVTAVGLTSAWLSGGGEDTTNRALQNLLDFPAGLRAVSTIPIGVPEKDVSSRYRRPIGQMTHWNRYEPEKFRTQALIDYYVANVRQFAMYRSVADANLGKTPTNVSGLGAMRSQDPRPTHPVCLTNSGQVPSPSCRHRDIGEASACRGCRHQSTKKAKIGV